MVLSRVSGLPETGRAITQRPHVPVEPGMRQLTLSRFSFIRTVTVGPGIAPGLLTLRSSRREGARGLPRRVADTAGGEFRPALRTLSALRAGPSLSREPAAPGLARATRLLTRSLRECQSEQASTHREIAVRRLVE